MTTGPPTRIPIPLAVDRMKRPEWRQRPLKNRWSESPTCTPGWHPRPGVRLGWGGGGQVGECNVGWCVAVWWGWGMCGVGWGTGVGWVGMCSVGVGWAVCGVEPTTVRPIHPKNVQSESTNMPVNAPAANRESVTGACARPRGCNKYAERCGKGRPLKGRQNSVRMAKQYVHARSVSGARRTADAAAGSAAKVQQYVCAGKPRFRA